MAVKASASETISCYRDTQSITRYYLLQSSTLAKPSKPTANPPGGSWDDTEPAYTSGSTNSLYLVDLTVFSDGTYQYSDVSLSSSYEAAKAAYNKAAAAAGTLGELTTTENERTVIDGTKIKTGSVTAGRITVRDADGNTVFDADANGKTVQIGGFAVDADKLTGEKVNISGSEITLTGPSSDVFEQSAHITDANIVWYANDGSGFGARGHIGTAAGFPTLNPDPDGYLHINALYKGSGIRFGYDGGTPEAWFDMDTYGMKAYMPIRVYNEDQSSYAPVNYDYARAWYYLVKQAEGDPGPDTVPVTGSGRAITSGAMYPADVSSAVTQLGVSGVTFEKSPSVYTIGKTAHVICRIVLAADGVYSGWVELFSGLPKARVSAYETCPYRGATYSTPLDICVDTDGVFWIRRGTYGSYAFYVNLCYPIA